MQSASRRPSGEPSGSSLTWHLRLNAATSVEGVIAAVKDYLALWSPEELAQLPEACRPGRIVDADDITVYALNLVREQFHGENGPALARMAGFFAAASRRVAQILAHAGHLSRPQAA